jgi:hypothetical protein
MLSRNQRALAGVGWTALATFLGAGCGQRIDVGSNVLWTAFFEGDNFNEWTDSGGAATASPAPPNTITVSSQRAHHGTYAAELTIDAGPDGTQENAGMALSGSLPVAAYYSAWYYIPQSVTVGTFWILFKFRMRKVADDPTTDGELYDLEVVNLPDGEMTPQLYDHRSGVVPLDLPGLVIPVGVWFQLEAYYRNAPDDTGRVTYWLNGQQMIDVSGQAMSPTPWVAWDAVNVGENLSPSTVSLFIDDCAVSLTRVGPNGITE